MLNIGEVLSALSTHRPVFHSEADFQHAIAWELHRYLPDAEVRLELPVQSVGKSLHVDIWVTRGRDTLPLELKYKTRKASLRYQQESFTLSNHSAQDTGRYDFIKDIQRLEQLLLGRACTQDYAIMLTNDSSYWSLGRDARSVDAEFRLNERRVLSGTLRWGARASAGTMRGREVPLVIAGVYNVHWVDYSQSLPSAGGTFRYLALEIRSEHHDSNN